MRVGGGFRQIAAAWELEEVGTLEWRQFLARFRPAEVPGAAGPGGVPVDRVAEAAVELAPVFALLAVTEVEVARVAEDGVERARRLRGAADQLATGIETDAAANAPRVRAAAARDFVPGNTGAAGLNDPVHGLGGEHLAERMAVLADRAVADVRALLGVPGTETDAPMNSAHR